MRPLRRSEGLLVDRVESTTMIVDTARNRAHSLTPEVALVWSLCDGARDAAGLAQASSLSADAVSAALAELERVGLLEASGMTRRRMLQVGAGVGGAVLISSVALPSVAAAASNPGGGSGGGGTGGSYSRTTPPPGAVDVDDIDSSPNGQGWLVGTGDIGIQAIAMPFTNGRNANLTGVAIEVAYYSGDQSTQLTVEILDATGGTPGTPLRIVNVPSTALPSAPAYGVTYITFDTPLPVLANQQLYLALTAPDTGTDVWYWRSNGATGPFSYSEDQGGTWTEYDGDLCQFQTYLFAFV